MRKIFSLFILANIVLCNSTSYAASNDKPPGYEQMFTEEFGYKAVNEALKEFERHFNIGLDLPTRIPSLTFTHQFGKFDDSVGDINDTLRVALVNENMPENHYNIDVRLIENGVEIHKRQTVDTVRLNDGNIAKYIEIGPNNRVSFHALVFERGHWQYILSIDSRVSNQLHPNELVKIANSF